MVAGTAEITNQATGKEQGVKTPVTGAGLDGEKGRAETKPERTLKQSEVDALLGKAGQRIQAKLETVTAERDTLKSQVGGLTAEITEAKESIEALTKDIEAMSENDPDKQALVKRRKEQEAELKTLKTERAEIAGDRSEIATWKRDQLVYTVADEFVTATGADIDKDSFKNAADKLKLGGREELETLAETMGLKPKGEVEQSPEDKTQPLITYSGKTSGGTDDDSNLSPREKIEKGLAKLTKK